MKPTNHWDEWRTRDRRVQAAPPSLRDRIVAWFRRIQPVGPIPESGYYYTYSPGYGDWIDAVPSGHQLAYVSMEDQTQAEHARIAAWLARRGMQAIYHACEVPFVWGTWTLRPDWQARIIAQLPLIDEFRKRNAWHSWYVMDEPGYRIRREDLTLVCAWLREQGVTTSMVDTDGHYTETWRARLVDYYGLDSYQQAGPTGPWSVDWRESEKRLRFSGANMVIPQAFNHPGYPIPGADALLAVDVARRLRAKGILWFLWPSIPGYLDGASSNPRVVQQIARACGVARPWTPNPRG